jgi:hypothetical protein
MTRIAILLLIPAAFAASDPPVIPTGLDAYRMWERWPMQRIGARAYMRSTYDRKGGNERADASHFLYQQADDFNVTLDVAGSGILYFVRYNHWHGSPWHYEVDGKDHIVRETSTEDPLHPKEGSVFEPAALFPSPLAVTWADTKGADLSWVPIGFEQSFRMAYSRTHYGTGYYIYHQFVPGAKLSQPLKVWDAKTPPAKDVLDLVNRAGSDLSPATGVKEAGGRTNVAAGASAKFWESGRGAGTVRLIEFSIPRANAAAFAQARLRITWDRRKEASVDAPVALFFGAGTFYNRDNREYLVKAFPMTVRFAADRIVMSCYFPMPYFRSAAMELVGGSEAVGDVQWRVKTAAFEGAPDQSAYFHATYRDHPTPEPGKDLVLLDTTKTEGGGDWSGNFVGTSFIFSHDGVLNTLEGDPRFFFDDSRTPQAQGTGTEEWGGGGDYWGGLNMTLPFAGHPAGAKSAKVAVRDEDKVETAYRFLLADLMPFGKNARIQLEHGGENESTQHYETVAYWYGLPAPSLIRTDELRVGDDASEQAHQYRSPDATAAYEVTSRYEWGPDTLKGKEIYPAETDRGRTTKTSSEFTLKIDKKNFGVMLRRKLDYSFPNQRALVSVDGTPAGVWYLAGSNTCVFSAPKDELGGTEHVVQTSNRRFRDDEFLLPLALTKGKSKIRVKVQFVPEKRPLYPGYPVPDLAWSEMRYTAYSFVMPAFR